MKSKLVVAWMLLLPMTAMTLFARPQVRAGSREYTLFQQISSEANPDTKIELITNFEKEFPQSKILDRVYLAAVEVYRAKEDREKINDYAERALKVDPNSITAMMLLARSYALESKNIDRAIELAQRALDRLGQLQTEPVPTGYAPDQWKQYLSSNTASADQILGYVKAIKARSEGVKKAAAEAQSANK